MNQSVTSSRPRGIARRLILATVLFSSLITLIATAIQLYRDYNRDLQLIDGQLQQIQDVHLPSIAGHLWLLDENAMQILVDGILQLPDMLYLEVSDGDRTWASGGTQEAENVIVRHYPLTYRQSGIDQEIGLITVMATLERVYQRLIDKAVDILVSNAIKTFLVAGFILLVFYYLVTRHLIDIASYVHSQDLDEEVKPLYLDRRSGERANPDELDLVVNELNLMRDKLQKSYATLKESESKYRGLYDTMAQGVVYQDENGKIISANNAALEFFGLSLDQILGRASVDPRWKTVHENGKDFPGETHPPMEALRSGRRVSNVTMGVYHPTEQKHRWIIVDSKPQFRKDEEKPYQVFSTFTDITERKQAEQEREVMIKELEIKNIELERFIYTVSHELKTPLVTISGFAGMLIKNIKEGSTDKLDSDYQQITSAIGTMSSLLNDVVELSRIGRVDEFPKDISLGKLAQDATKSVAHENAEHDVEINILPDLPVINGDPVRLREVLQNLIENSIKFMGDQSNPQIEIGARDDGLEVICYVQDNGLGIDPTYHEKIFGLFEHLDPQAEGTGVGLTLAHRIVELQGGRIWVESAGAGKGSTFFFSIPKVL